MVNSKKIFVIKHGKRKNEEFKPKKLYDSIIATCASVRTPEGQAEEIAQNITDKVTKWAESKLEITYRDIRIQTHKALKSLHKDAAYLYENYRKII